MNNMDQMLNIADVSYDVETYLIKVNENRDINQRNYTIYKESWNKMNEWFVEN